MVFRGVMYRQQQPAGSASAEAAAVMASVAAASSSITGSESESNSAMGAQSGASQDSQRSVYLHATTVADIPPAILSQRQERLASARASREDVSKLSQLSHSGSNG